MTDTDKTVDIENSILILDNGNSINVNKNNGTEIFISRKIGFMLTFLSYRVSVLPLRLKTSYRNKKTLK